MTQMLDAEQLNRAPIHFLSVSQFPTSFADWRRRVASAGLPPVVAVAGSRGKSTVVRLLQAIADEAGLRTALWTNLGVEIEGVPQSGELLPWQRSLELLGNGTLDLAFQELPWSTVHAVGLPPHAYPAAVVTNLCGNNGSCLLHDHTRVAVAALSRLEQSVHPCGFAAMNGDDFAVSGDDFPGDARRLLFGLSRDTPLVRHHLDRRGLAAWLEDDQLRVGTDGANSPVVGVRDLPFALQGTASFQIANALAATIVAAGCGIPFDVIGRGLATHEVPVSDLPGSFNLLHVHGATVIVDRPAHPWFLRSTLRAVGQVPASRLIRVVGQLEGVETGDLVEVGRMLGRDHGAILLHSANVDPVRTKALRAGITSNDVPPLVIHSRNERSAIRALLKMLRPDDVAMVLADQPAPVLRLLADAQHLAAIA